MGVVHLAPPPTIENEVRDSVVGLLERALEEARAGNISSVVVIALHPNGEWSDWQSGTQQVSEMIGRLEIAKQSRIMNLLRGE